MTLIIEHGMEKKEEAMQEKTELKLLASYEKPKEEAIEGKANKKADGENHPYDRGYFDGDTEVGYRAPGYHDFPSNYNVLNAILKRAPKSVLELGGGRGYITRKLEAQGIRATCMDIAEYCYHTRATDSFVLQDCTKVPWSFKDNEFDLIFTKDFLEHLPEDKIDIIIKESARVSKRALHAITFSTHPNARDDPTHRSLHTRDWWVGRFNQVTPKYTVEIVDKEEIEGDPVTVPGPDGLAKLNCGSWLDMFHYGWTNIDKEPLQDYAQANGFIFQQADLLQTLPYSDNSIDLIYFSHTLEHFTREEGFKILSEFYRVLKPKGVVRIIVPDTKRLVKMYQDDSINECRYFNICVERAKDDAESLFHMLLAGHKTIYDEQSIVNLVKEIGFTEARRMGFNESMSKEIETQTLDLYPTISLYVEAKKSERVIITKPELTYKQESMPKGTKDELEPYKQYLEDKIKEGKQHA